MSTIDFTTLSWAEVEPKLRASGIDTSRIKPVQQVMLLARLRADGPVEGLTWREVADDLAEQHPTWETLDHRRRRHAAHLLDEAGNPDFGASGVAELVDHRFAGVTLYDGQSAVRAVGDTDDDICEFVIDVLDDTAPEWVERIVDLNTGRNYAGDGDFETFVTVTFNGARASRTF
jgi:hypothetical protein